MRALMKQFAATLSRRREIKYEFNPKFQEYSETWLDTWLQVACQWAGAIFEIASSFWQEL